MRLTLAAWVSNGSPRRFCEVNEKRRCSISFHLLVPGGRWQAEITSPIYGASFWSSTASFPSRCAPALSRELP